HAAFQLADEIPLIQKIPAPLERADAFGDLDDGRHRRGRSKRRWRRVGVLRRELQREISAQGVPRDANCLQAVDGDKLVDHVLRVRGQPGMKETGGQMLRAAAITLIQTNDVEPTRESLSGNAL